VRFKVNTPPVIHQTLDGEVIVVNLDTGTYYSFAGVGAEIWSSVERGASLAETVDEALARYDAPRETVEAAVMRFVDELTTEELIAPEDGPEPPAAPARTGDAAKAPFAEPLLNKYTDMQELLLLDPIHEVDERGWPHSLEGSAQAGEA